MSPHSRIIGLTFAVCEAPYAGLRLYLALGMHESSSPASLPDSRILGGLFLLGAVVPSAGVGWILYRALRDRLHFQLSGLAAAYLALILIFASGFEIIGSSSVEPSFKGMPLLWARGEVGFAELGGAGSSGMPAEAVSAG